MTEQGETPSGIKAVFNHAKDSAAKVHQQTKDALGDYYSPNPVKTVTNISKDAARGAVRIVTEGLEEGSKKAGNTTTNAFLKGTEAGINIGVSVAESTREKAQETKRKLDETRRQLSQTAANLKAKANEKRDSLAQSARGFKDGAKIAKQDYQDKINFTINRARDITEAGRQKVLDKGTQINAISIEAGQRAEHWLDQTLSDTSDKVRYKIKDSLKPRIEAEKPRTVFKQETPNVLNELRLGTKTTHSILKQALDSSYYTDQTIRLATYLIDDIDLNRLNPKQLDEILERSRYIVSSINSVIARSGYQGKPQDIARDLYQAQTLSPLEWRIAQLLLQPDLPITRAEITIEKVLERFGLRAIKKQPSAA